MKRNGTRCRFVLRVEYTKHRTFRVHTGPYDVADPEAVRERWIACRGWAVCTTLDAFGEPVDWSKRPGVVRVRGGWRATVDGAELRKTKRAALVDLLVDEYEIDPATALAWVTRGEPFGSRYIVYRCKSGWLHAFRPGAPRRNLCPRHHAFGRRSWRVCRRPHVWQRKGRRLRSGRPALRLVRG